MFWKRRMPKLTTTKWLSIRRIRQDACIEVLSRNTGVLDQSFFDALDIKRSEYDKLFWKVGITQITITAFLMLSLLSIEDVSFTIFGFSATALSKFREFLLFCHALTIGYAIVLQQYIFKLEDFLVAHARSRFKNVEEDDDEMKIYLLRYLSPIEAFHLIFLPYKRHLFHNALSKLILKVHAISQVLSAFGFAAFSMIVPLIAAVMIALSPNFGWLSYCIVIYWTALAVFSTASALVNFSPLPYTDFSYVTQLAEIQKKNPARHKQLIDEMVRTSKLPELR